MADKDVVYNFRNIRKLLTDGFGEQELRAFCFDESLFRPVYNRLAASAGKSDMVCELIEYADQKSLVDVLLKWAKEHSPKKYSENKPYYSSEPISPPSNLEQKQPGILSFEIRIIRYGPVSYKAEITSSLGTLFTKFKLPFDKQIIEATLLDFRQNLQTTRNVPHGEDYTSQVAKALSPEQLGGDLFECIFQPDVVELYKASRQRAKRSGQALPVILNIDPHAGDLINLPWEFLYDTSARRVRGEFLAFGAETPVIRRWLRADPVNFSYDPPLRVLLISANPEGSAMLNVQGEHSLIYDKLASLNQEGQTKVKIDYLSGATLAKLKPIVRDPRRTPHVIHFMGHGGLGSLLLEDKERGQKNVSEQSLSIILRNAPSLRLIVLNACETAQTDFLDKQLGVAQSLADAGIPAIVAMQFVISDEAALAFAGEFYQLIAEGSSIDSAVTWGRIAIQNEFEDSATKEWGTPVLYLQAPDGYILADLLEQQKSHKTRRPAHSGATAEIDTSASQVNIPYVSKTEQIRREAKEKEEKIGSLQKERRDLIKKLIDLENQVAQDELDVNPHTTYEIADIREEIKKLERELKQLDPEMTFSRLSPLPTEDPLDTLSQINDSKMVRKIKFDDTGIHSQGFKFYTKGGLALKKGDWRTALSYLSRAEKLSPGLPDVGDLAKQARQNYQQTSDGQTKYYQLDALYDQAQVHLSDHNLDRAASLLEGIVRTDAGYKNAYKLALETRTQADKEKVEREKQAKLTELFDQAKAYTQAENWLAAVSVLTQLVDIDEDYREAQQLLNEATKQSNLLEAYKEGELHFQKSDWTKAVAAFGKVASIDENYRDVAKLLTLSRHQKQLDVWTQVAEDYLSEGDWEAVIEILEENHVAEEREPAKLALNYAYARCYRQQRDWAQVVKHLQEVLEARPNYRPDLDELYQEATEELHFQQQFEKTITHIEQNEWPAAKATLESIVQAKPDYPMAKERLQQVNEEIRLADLYKKAQDALEFKQWAKAIPFLKEIPHYKDAPVLLAEAQKQLELAAFFRDGLEAAGSGRWSEAISAFERVVEIEPDHQEALAQLKNAQDKVTLEHSFNQGMQALQLGQQNCDLERLNEAVSCLETVAKIDQRYRGVTNRLREAKRERFLLQNYLQGMEAFENEQWVEAIEHWQVIVKDENEPDYHGDSARRLAQAKHQQRLADLYLEANQHFRAEEWANAIMLLEELQQETGGEDYRDAASLLGEARLQQELFNHYQQAEQLFAAEQWDKAVQHLEQIQAKRTNYRQTEVERMLEDAQTNREAARSYEAGLEALKAERWAEAVTCFDKTFSLKPDFRDVSTRLRQARQQQTLHERYQAAMEMMNQEAWTEAIEHLIAIQGLDPDFKDAHKQLEEAERQQQLAADYQFALAHFEAERWAEARDAFDDILARQKDYKAAQQQRDEAQQQLDMADKYERALKRIEEAAQQPENWQLAVDLLKTVSEWQADYRDTPSLLDQAQHQAELYALYQRATVLGEKNEIPDLEQAVELLAQITEVDLNYRDAVAKKAEFEKKAMTKKDEERRIEIKTRFELAIESAGKKEFSQVLSSLGRIVSLDQQYQTTQKKIAEIIQQYEAKKRLGDQLMAQEKFDEAVIIFEECEQEELELPGRIQTILKQNLPG